MLEKFKQAMGKKLEKMAANNEKRYAGSAPDCCTMNKQHPGKPANK